MCSNSNRLKFHGLIDRQVERESNVHPSRNVPACKELGVSHYNIQDHTFDLKETAGTHSSYS